MTDAARRIEARAGSAPPYTQRTDKPAGAGRSGDTGAGLAASLAGVGTATASATPMAGPGPARLRTQGRALPPRPGVIAVTAVRVGRVVPGSTGAARARLPTRPLALLAGPRHAVTSPEAGTGSPGRRGRSGPVEPAVVRAKRSSKTGVGPASTSTAVRSGSADEERDTGCPGAAAGAVLPGTGRPSLPAQPEPTAVGSVVAAVLPSQVTVEGAAGAPHTRTEEPLTTSAGAQLLTRGVAGVRAGPGVGTGCREGPAARAAAEARILASHVSPAVAEPVLR